MRKFWAILCLLATFFTVGCNMPSAGQSSSELKKPGVHTHKDEDLNGYCDGCGIGLNVHEHKDEDGDKRCDNCGLDMHEHNDGDGDNRCDDCEKNMRVTIDFYSINDLHGKFDDTYANIGVDEMTTYLRNAQTANPNTVLLSAGDMWQGSAESNFTKGKLITEWMNDLDFAAMTLGNHEFDWGESFIETNEAIAEFPFLAINVYDTQTNQRVEYCQPSVLIERSGVQIGIIGAIGDCYSDIAEEQVEGVYFKVQDDLTELVKAEALKLRGQGADLIVYSLHDAADSNLSYYDLELSDGYVDLVFEGHSHTIVKEKDEHGVWHLQTGGDNGEGISYAQVTVDLALDAVTVSSARNVYHSEYQSLSDDPAVDGLLEKYADELTKVNEVLGYNDAYRNAGALANFAAQAMYLAGEARWGEDARYAGKIVLGGGYINVRSPRYLPAGEVTYGDIYPLFTFDNPLVLCRVSGSRLKSQFINSSNYYTYYGDDGLRIKNNVDENGTYYVIVDTYCANYNFNGLGFLPIVEYYDEARQFFNRDALAEFIKDGGMGSAKPAPTELTSISDILAIGEALVDGAQTPVKYRVQGRIALIENDNYGNMYIEDGAGNRLYVYGVYDQNGNRYSQMSIKPQVGETVVLEGVIKRFIKNGTPLIELFESRLISIS